MQFDAVREELLRAGVAPRRVRRYLHELDGHLFDLTKQEIAAGYDSVVASVRARAVLGSDHELTDGWLQEPKLKSLAARAPWLVFVLSPLAAIVLTAAIQFLSFVALLRWLGVVGLHSSYAHVLPALTYAMALLGNLGVIPIVAALFVVMAWRQRVTFRWPLIGTMMMVFLSLHWDTSPLLQNPPGWDAFRLTVGWHHSTDVLNIRATPVLLSVWREQFAAQAPLFVAEYLLILLPVLWLYLALKQNSAGGKSLQGR